MSSAVVLFGRSQPELGSVGEQSGPGIAVALSRGGAAKPYPHTDPNEDAVLAACGAAGTLVAIADGHWGARAAEIAIEVVRDAHLEDFVAGPARSADRWYQDVLHLLVGANDAIRKAQSDEQRSRTTFALALARPAEKLLVATSVGDSHLFTIAPSGTNEILPRPRRISVLGHEAWTASQTERMARFDVRPLGDLTALVAVTDGLSEKGIGVEDPPAVVASLVAGERSTPPAVRAARIARSIVDAALAAHVANNAGDNVSAGVAWLEES